MPDAFTLTIIFIIVAAVFAAFIRGRKIDKCLKDFRGDLVTLELTDGKIVWGRLDPVNTGIELLYEQSHKDNSGHVETSFILYKQEFPMILALLRYHDKLTPQARQERKAQLKKVYHPKLLRRSLRKLRNFCNTVRDSVLEVADLFIGQAKKKALFGQALAGQDKYVTQIKQEFVSSLNTAFEPLLERHIGHKVVLELTRGDKTEEYSCILKDYSAEFIEALDVEYAAGVDKGTGKADIIALRKYATVRHLGEMKAEV